MDASKSWCEQYPRNTCVADRAFGPHAVSITIRLLVSVVFAGCLRVTDMILIVYRCNFFCSVMKQILKCCTYDPIVCIASCAKLFGTKSTL